ncbi:MAG: hypothetical protein ACI8V7_000363 [Candidatus Paceibacteria bacterium]|jgi:hypothetical protein
MLKKPGVYTIDCNECKAQSLMHLNSDESISPDHCKWCKIEFKGIDNGEQRGSYVGIVKEVNKIEITFNKEAEEKTDEKSFKIKKNRKKW